jgi:hypothetical protein
LFDGKKYFFELLLNRFVLPAAIKRERKHFRKMRWVNVKAVTFFGAEQQQKKCFLLPFEALFLWYGFTG